MMAKFVSSFFFPLSQSGFWTFTGVWTDTDWMNRLMALSYGEKELTREMWERAKRVEREGRERAK